MASRSMDASSTLRSLLAGVVLLLAGCQPAGQPAATPGAGSPAPASAAATATGATVAPTTTTPASSLATTAATAAPAASPSSTPSPTGATAPASPAATTPAAPASPVAGATSTAAPGAGPSASATGQPTGIAATDDWTTYHRDNRRTGVAPTTGASGRLAPVWRSATLDEDVYAEPLIVGGRVIVATEANSVYSFDLASGRPAWHVNLGGAVPRSSLPCGNIATTGITGTPLADAAGGLLYVVAFVQPGRHELVALDLASGATRFRVPIDPAGSDPLPQQQRAALALAGGRVYVAFGGLFGDCGDYHGWVVAADARTGEVRASYQVPTEREGGIWAPSGPAIDASGNVFVATGNGSSEDPSHFDYGDAVLRLTPDLRLADWFAPSNWAELNATDADIGSVGPALLDDGLLFQIGKSGVGYLLRSSRLGKLGGQVFSAPVCGSAFGGTAYRAPTLYVPCTDGLVALSIQGQRFAVAWRGPGTFAGPPIVAGGLVWTIGRDGTLYALDPATGQVRGQTRLGAVAHFASPSASGPYLVVPAGREVIVERME